MIDVNNSIVSNSNAHGQQNSPDDGTDKGVNVQRGAECKCTGKYDIDRQRSVWLRPGRWHEYLASATWQSPHCRVCSGNGVCDMRLPSGDGSEIFPRLHTTLCSELTHRIWEHE
ncbi:hypothetical protein J6590_046806 [Homalodisca vitripennis]|nr:hypothetical protein J6590_046806 [Homalodisca vitripennis]